MKKIIFSIIVIILLSTTSIVKINAFELVTENSKEYDSVVNNNQEPFDGYTLLNPWLSGKTYLINNTDKKVVHKWKSDYRFSLAAYLLENGNLIRTSSIINNPFLWAGGCGGRVEIFNWDGNLIWDFTYMNETYCLHNDIEVLPNGNILMIVWESKTIDEAIAAGCDPNRNDYDLIEHGHLLTDYIIEVKPTGPTSGDIVWEWHLWDHLIQDYDPSKDNYRVIANHPELLDINHEGRRSDLTHINSIYYNETYDQLLLSLCYASEIWVIDHSTNTTEASGHTNGKYGKGGDALYRWGNPQVYNRGDKNDQKLFYQHDVRWIEDGYLSEGHITIFNNGYKRPDGKYSSVFEIVLPVDENGNFYLEPDSSYPPGSTYGPKEPIWIYAAENPTDFYSGFLSGAQRLSNGNTFICSGDPGFLFEVTPEKEIVWEYFNPYPIRIPFNLPAPFGSLNHVFKTQCYTKNYPGIGEFSISEESEILVLEGLVTENSPSSQTKEELTQLNLKR